MIGENGTELEILVLDGTSPSFETGSNFYSSPNFITVVTYVDQEVSNSKFDQN